MFGFKKGKKKKAMNFNYKKRLYIIVLFFVAFIPFFSACNEIVYAAGGIKTQVSKKHGGWAPNGISTDGEHSDIYDEPDEGFLDYLTDKVTDIGEAKKAVGELVLEGDLENYVFNMFTCVIGTVAYSIGKTMQKFGIGICNIIYGRVLGYSTVDLSGFMVVQPLAGNYTETTFFHFELVEGNVYGYIGAIMYAGFRILGVVGIVCVCLTKLAVAIVKPSGDARESLKSTIGNSCIMLAALFLMPYVLDLFIYVRNVLLYGIGMFCYEQFGTYNLLDAFVASYADTNHLNVWVFDLGMLGMVIITLYFAFQYMSVAMGTMLMFIIFPVVCLVSSYDKNAMKSWVREMIGYLMVPVIDALLLAVPLIIGKVAETQVILQVVSMGMIIPARQAVRSMLGMSSSSGMDRVGAMGAMAAIAMAKTIAGTVAKVVGTFASGGIANVASKAGGAMAGAKKEALTSATEQLNGENGFGGSAVTRLPFDMDADKREKYQSNLNEYNKLLAKGDEEGAQKFRTENLKEVEEFLKPKSSAEDREKDKVEGQQRLDALGGTSVGTEANLAEINRLMEENRVLNSNLANGRVANAEIKEGINKGEYTPEEGKEMLLKNDVIIAKDNQKLRENLDKISALQEENRTYDASVKKYRDYYGRDGIPEDKKNEIEMRYANAMNFDSGVFRSLTEEQKANFYAERAINERRRAKGMAVGMAGGAALGYGGSMFMDNSTKIGAITMGSSAGGAVGGMFADRISSITNSVKADSANYVNSTASVSSVVNSTTGTDGELTALAMFNERQMRDLLKNPPIDSASYSNVMNDVLSRCSLSDLHSCPQMDVDSMCSRIARELKAELSVVTDCVSRIRKIEL